MLCDENLPHTLRRHLTRFETVTAAYAGFAGLKNGMLLDAAERAGFEVLITGDKTLHHEQNMKGRRIALVIISAVSWPVIEPYAVKIAAAVEAATPGSFTSVDCGTFKRSKSSGSATSQRD